MMSTREWQNRKLGPDVGRSMRWVTVAARDASRAIERLAAAYRDGHVVERIIAAGRAPEAEQ